MDCIFDPACELLPPPWMGRNYTCVLLSVDPLLYLLSDLLPPPPLPNVQYIQTMCDCGGGGVEMYCGPFYAGVLHSVSDQIQNLQNCFTAPNKMTSEDDIKGLVSFLTSFVHGLIGT
jgi:hypothetical protein